MPAARIYLVGAHSTGKTTLARWIRDRYRLPMISEVARGVLAAADPSPRAPPARSALGSEPSSSGGARP